MEEILDILLTVQRLNDEIKDTKLKIEETPNKITTLEEEIEKAKSKVQEKSDRIKEIKKTYKIKEGDLAENESKITKLNGQTFSVKTNEEYRALITEVDYLKKENKKTEDEMINLLEEEEKLKEATDKLENETKDFIDKRIVEINELKKECEELIEKQKQINISFENNFNILPEDTKQVYKRISKVRDRAVCEITDNTCTGCYANLTFQFLNELKKRNKILCCGNCGRILIFVRPVK